MPNLGQEIAGRSASEIVAIVEKEGYTSVYAEGNASVFRKGDIYVTVYDRPNGPEIRTDVSPDLDEHIHPLDPSYEPPAPGTVFSAVGAFLDKIEVDMEGLQIATGMLTEAKIKAKGSAKGEMKIQGKGDSLVVNGYRFAIRLIKGIPQGEPRYRFYVTNRLYTEWELWDTFETIKEGKIKANKHFNKLPAGGFVIPYFIFTSESSFAELQAWVADRIAAYAITDKSAKSKQNYYQSDEYAQAFPIMQAAYENSKSTKPNALAAMKNFGLVFGDKVQAKVLTLNNLFDKIETQCTGTLVNVKGDPSVKLDKPIGTTKTVAWHTGWKKIEGALTKDDTNQKMKVAPGLLKHIAPNVTVLDGGVKNGVPWMAYYIPGVGNKARLFVNVVTTEGEWQDYKIMNVVNTDNLLPLAQDLSDEIAKVYPKGNFAALDQYDQKVLDLLDPSKQVSQTTTPKADTGSLTKYAPSFAAQVISNTPGMKIVSGSVLKTGVGVIAAISQAPDSTTYDVSTWNTLSSNGAWTLYQMENIGAGPDIMKAHSLLSDAVKVFGDKKAAQGFAYTDLDPSDMTAIDSKTDLPGVSTVGMAPSIVSWVGETKPVFTDAYMVDADVANGVGRAVIAYKKSFGSPIVIIYYITDPNGKWHNENADNFSSPEDAVKIAKKWMSELPTVKGSVKRLHPIDVKAVVSAKTHKLYSAITTAPKFSTSHPNLGEYPIIFEGGVENGIPWLAVKSMSDDETSIKYQIYTIKPGSDTWNLANETHVSDQKDAVHSMILELGMKKFKENGGVFTNLHHDDLEAIAATKNELKGAAVKLPKLTLEYGSAIVKFSVLPTGAAKALIQTTQGKSNVYILTSVGGKWQLSPEQTYLDVTDIEGDVPTNAALSQPMNVLSTEKVPPLHELTSIDVATVESGVKNGFGYAIVLMEGTPKYEVRVTILKDKDDFSSCEWVAFGSANTYAEAHALLMSVDENKVDDIGVTNLVEGSAVPFGTNPLPKQPAPKAPPEAEWADVIDGRAYYAAKYKKGYAKFIDHKGGWVFVKGYPTLKDAIASDDYRPYPGPFKGKPEISKVDTLSIVKPTLTAGVFTPEDGHSIEWVSVVGSVGVLVTSTKAEKKGKKSEAKAKKNMTQYNTYFNTGGGWELDNTKQSESMKPVIEDAINQASSMSGSIVAIPSTQDCGPMKVLPYPKHVTQAIKEGSEVKYQKIVSGIAFIVTHSGNTYYLYSAFGMTEGEISGDKSGYVISEGYPWYTATYDDTQALMKAVSTVAGANYGNVAGVSGMVTFDSISSAAAEKPGSNILPAPSKPSEGHNYLVKAGIINGHGIAVWVESTLESKAPGGHVNFVGYYCHGGVEGDKTWTRLSNRKEYSTAIGDVASLVEAFEPGSAVAMEGGPVDDVMAGGVNFLTDVVTPAFDPDLKIVSAKISNGVGAIVTELTPTIYYLYVNGSGEDEWLENPTGSSFSSISVAIKSGQTYAKDNPGSITAFFPTIKVPPADAKPSEPAQQPFGTTPPCPASVGPNDIITAFIYGGRGIILAKTPYSGKTCVYVTDVKSGAGSNGGWTNVTNSFIDSPMSAWNIPDLIATIKTNILQNHDYSTLHPDIVKASEASAKMTKSPPFDMSFKGQKVKPIMATIYKGWAIVVARDAVEEFRSYLCPSAFLYYRMIADVGFGSPMGASDKARHVVDGYHEGFLKTVNPSLLASIASAGTDKDTGAMTNLKVLPEFTPTVSVGGVGVSVAVEMTVVNGWGGLVIRKDKVEYPSIESGQYFAYVVGPDSPDSWMSLSMTGYPNPESGNEAISSAVGFVGKGPYVSASKIHIDTDKQAATGKHLPDVPEFHDPSNIYIEHEVEITNGWGWFIASHHDYESPIDGDISDVYLAYVVGPDSPYAWATTNLDGLETLSDAQASALDHIKAAKPGPYTSLPINSLSKGAEEKPTTLPDLSIMKMMHTEDVAIVVDAKIVNGWGFAVIHNNSSSVYYAFVVAPDTGGLWYHTNLSGYDTLDQAKINMKFLENNEKGPYVTAKPIRAPSTTTPKVQEAPTLPEIGPKEKFFYLGLYKGCLIILVKVGGGGQKTTYYGVASADPKHPTIWSFQTAFYAITGHALKDIYGKIDAWGGTGKYTKVVEPIGYKEGGEEPIPKAELPTLGSGEVVVQSEVYKGWAVIVIENESGTPFYVARASEYPGAEWTLSTEPSPLLSKALDGIKSIIDGLGHSGFYKDPVAIPEPKPFKTTKGGPSTFNLPLIPVSDVIVDSRVYKGWAVLIMKTPDLVGAPSSQTPGFYYVRVAMGATPLKNVSWQSVVVDQAAKTSDEAFKQAQKFIDAKGSEGFFTSPVPTLGSETAKGPKSAPASASLELPSITSHEYYYDSYLLMGCAVVIVRDAQSGEYQAFASRTPGIWTPHIVTLYQKSLDDVKDDIAKTIKQGDKGSYTQAPDIPNKKAGSPSVSNAGMQAVTKPSTLSDQLPVFVEPDGMTFETSVISNGWGVAIVRLHADNSVIVYVTSGDYPDKWTVMDDTFEDIPSASSAAEDFLKTYDKGPYKKMGHTMSSKGVKPFVDTKPPALGPGENISDVYLIKGWGVVIVRWGDPESFTYLPIVCKEPGSAWLMVDKTSATPDEASNDAVDYINDDGSEGGFKTYSEIVDIINKVAVLTPSSFSTAHEGSGQVPILDVKEHFVSGDIRNGWLIAVTQLGSNYHALVRAMPLAHWLRLLIQYPGIDEAMAGARLFVDLQGAHGAFSQSDYEAFVSAAQDVEASSGKTKEFTGASMTECPLGAYGELIGYGIHNGWGYALVRLAVTGKPVTFVINVSGWQQEYGTWDLFDTYDTMDKATKYGIPKVKEHLDVGAGGPYTTIPPSTKSVGVETSKQVSAAPLPAFVIPNGCELSGPIGVMHGWGYAIVRNTDTNNFQNYYVMPPESAGWQPYIESYFSEMEAEAAISKILGKYKDDPGPYSGPGGSTKTDANNKKLTTIEVPVIGSGCAVLVYPNIAPNGVAYCITSELGKYVPYYDVGDGNGWKIAPLGDLPWKELNLALVKYASSLPQGNYAQMVTYKYAPTTAKSVPAIDLVKGEELWQWDPMKSEPIMSVINGYGFVCIRKTLKANYQYYVAVTYDGHIKGSGREFDFTKKTKGSLSDVWRRDSHNKITSKIGMGVGGKHSEAKVLYLVKALKKALEALPKGQYKEAAEAPPSVVVPIPEPFPPNSVKDAKTAKDIYTYVTQKALNPFEFVTFMDTDLHTIAGAHDVELSIGSIIQDNQGNDLEIVGSTQDTKTKKRVIYFIVNGSSMNHLKDEEIVDMFDKHLIILPGMTKPLGESVSYFSLDTGSIPLEDLEGKNSDKVMAEHLFYTIPVCDAPQISGSPIMLYKGSKLTTDIPESTLLGDTVTLAILGSVLSGNVNLEGNDFTTRRPLFLEPDDIYGSLVSGDGGYDAVMRGLDDTKHGIIGLGFTPKNTLIQTGLEGGSPLCIVVWTAAGGGAVVSVNNPIDDFFLRALFLSVDEAMAFATSLRMVAHVNDPAYEVVEMAFNYGAVDVCFGPDEPGPDGGHTVGECIYKFIPEAGMSRLTGRDGTHGVILRHGRKRGRLSNKLPRKNKHRTTRIKECAEEPWRMTREEYDDYFGVPYRPGYEEPHKAIVAAALREGKIVPDSVMKDYPDLLYLAVKPTDKKESVQEARFEDMYSNSFVDWRKKWIAKSRAGGTDNLYVQFTNHMGDTLDKKAFDHPNHQDPAAIYAYPMEYVLKYPSDVWYGNKAKFLRVLKDTSKKCLILTNMTRGKANSVLSAMGFEDPEKLMKIYREAYPDRITSKASSAAQEMFGVVQMRVEMLNDPSLVAASYKGSDVADSRPNREQTKLFIKAGYDALRDDARNEKQAVIHQSEPQQMAFLTRASFDVLDVVQLRSGVTDGDDVVGYKPDPKFEDRKFAAVIADKVFSDKIIGHPIYDYDDGTSFFWTKGGRRIGIQWFLEGGEPYIKKHKADKLKTKHFPTIYLFGENGEIVQDYGTGDSFEKIALDLTGKWSAAKGRGDPDWKPETQDIYKDAYRKAGVSKLEQQVSAAREADLNTFRESIASLAKRFSHPIGQSMENIPDKDWFDTLDFYKNVHNLISYRYASGGEVDFLKTWDAQYSKFFNAVGRSRNEGLHKDVKGLLELVYSKAKPEELMLKKGVSGLAWVANVDDVFQESIQLSEAKEDLLFHTTDFDGLVGILRSRKLDPTKGPRSNDYEPFISFSEIPLVSSNIGASPDVVLAFRRASVLPEVEKVDYNEKWFDDHMDQVYYITGLSSEMLAWNVEDFYEAPEGDDDDDWEAEDEAREQAEREALLSSFMNFRSDEREWITKDARKPLAFSTKDLVKILVVSPNQTKLTSDALKKEGFDNVKVMPLSSAKFKKRKALREDATTIFSAMIPCNLPLSSSNWKSRNMDVACNILALLPLRDLLERKSILETALDGAIDIGSPDEGTTRKLMSLYERVPLAGLPNRNYKTSGKTLSETTLRVQDGDQVTVRIVKGEEKRSDRLDVVYQGGHHYVYPWIPDGEIHLQSSMGNGRLLSSYVHEFVEMALMKYRGFSYPEAHKFATEVERDFVKRTTRPEDNDEGSSIDTLSIGVVHSELPT